MRGASFNRRFFLIGGMAAVSGCAVLSGDGTDAPSDDGALGAERPAPVRPQFDDTRALMPDITQNLRIEEVTFRLAPDFDRNAPHNGVTRDFIEDRMRAAIVPGLPEQKRDGLYPVRAEVELLRFAFANVAVGIVVGAKGSFATFRTTLFYLDTGQLVGRPATNRAGTEARPTLLGLLAIKTPPEEVRIVAERSPEAIAIRLFGRQNQPPRGT